MTIARPQVFLTMALGLVISSFGTTSAIADDSSGHSHADGHEHDHGAMSTEKEISAALATLSTADRKQATAQRFCPIMEYNRLGGDGAPIKVMVNGTPIFVCCEGCIEDAVAGGKKTLAKVNKLTKASAALATLPAGDRAAAEAQKYCAIANQNFLGSMGKPIKLELSGKPVFLCCKGCVAKAKANPAAALAKVEALKKAGAHEGHEGSGSAHKH